MSYEVEIVNTAPSVLAVVRTRTTWQTLGKTIIDSLNLVYSFLKTAPVRQQGFNVVVYLDGLSTIEIGVQVSSEFESTDSVACSSTPAGFAATTVHFGPYADLPKAHAAVRAWCARNGKGLAGPNWEVYGHWADDPGELRTDVYYLLEDG